MHPIIRIQSYNESITRKNLFRNNRNFERSITRGDEGKYRSLVGLYPYNSSVCKQDLEFPREKYGFHRFSFSKIRSVIIHSFPRARTPIHKLIGKVHRRLQHMHTHAQVLVRYTWSGVPKLALPLDRVQNQRTCYFCNLFTLGYRSDGRVAGGTQADAIYGRVEKREGKGRDLLTLATLARFFNCDPIDRRSKSPFPSFQNKIFPFRVVESCAIWISYIISKY